MTHTTHPRGRCTDCGERWYGHPDGRFCANCVQRQLDSLAHDLTLAEIAIENIVEER